MFWLGLLMGWILGFIGAALFIGAVREWQEDHPELEEGAPDDGASGGYPRLVRSNPGDKAAPART